MSAAMTTTTGETPGTETGPRAAIRWRAALHYATSSVRLLSRNWGFVLFSVAMPVLLYVLFDQLFYGSGTDSTDSTDGTDGSVGGVSGSAIIMVSMACYGSLGAAMSGGAQLAVERRSGWFRQLSLTTLPSRAFLWARAAVIMILVLPALLLVFLAGFAVGASGRRFRSGSPRWA